MAINDLFEVRANGPIDVQWSVQVEDRTVTFHSVPLSNDEPIRLLVLGSDASVRQKVVDEMAVRETLLNAE